MLFWFNIFLTLAYYGKLANIFKFFNIIMQRFFIFNYTFALSYC